MTPTIVYSSVERRVLSVVFIAAYFVASCESFRHFYSESTLLNGVHERNLFLNGIRVVEMVAGPREGSPRGIVVRQLSNKRQVVNLIYNGVPLYLMEEEGFPEGHDDPSPIGSDEDGLELRECKVERDREEVKRFIENFDKKMHVVRQDSKHGTDSRKTLNSTFVSLTEDQETVIPLSFEPLTRFKELKHTCFTVNRRIRKLARAERREMLQAAHQQNEPSLLKRSRRGLRELFILPGTKWCGNGRLAKSYSDLDGYMVADHCCRVHDLCPSSIPRLSRKFGLYNYGLTTISHCSCDKRFKTCLKQTGTGAADVVGNVFFSIVRSNCFDFQRKKVCKKRGFWSCLKWGYEKQAVIRGSISWN